MAPTTNFDLSNANSLLATIQADSTIDTINLFVTSLAEAVNSDPTKADAIAETLASLFAIPESQTLDIRGVDPDDAEVTTPLQSTFLIALGEWLNYALHETSLVEPKRTIVEPSNTVLTAAVFSAALLKTGVLASPSYVFSFTRQGLQLPNAVRETERQEIVAIGACLQLLVAGKIMLDRWLEKSDGSDGIVQALKALSDGKVILSENGRVLLQKTIDLAEQGFGTGTTARNAWSVVFPEK
ncbi:hypothetical protein BDZ94DRAFT_799545 [Collybia nuda]|uniref:Uncharacterized protein n=1 Tax=Collybia nuda TaxID=64659 RepID=A0A9P6CIB1_9AGAR|nr:hypothetical protein BDZ94DRAFT_799545 [Collybia nuda]